LPDVRYESILALISHVTLAVPGKMLTPWADRGAEVSIFPGSDTSGSMMPIAPDRRATDHLLWMDLEDSEPSKAFRVVTLRWAPCGSVLLLGAIKMGMLSPETSVVPAPSAADGLQ
jgi:hypothetical protein